MQALGLIETKGLIAAIESADAMLKAADVNLLEKTYVGGGLVSIVITGDVAAVKASVEAGTAAVKLINSTLLVSDHVIPRPHEELDNIILSTKTKVKEESLVEKSCEHTAETMVEVHEAAVEEVAVEKIVVEEIAVESSESKELEAEEPRVSSQIDLSNMHNKETVDKIVFEHGLEETIEGLRKLKVIELRNLARQYKNFGIAGRKISKADKKLLITEFKKYYGNN